MWRCEDDVLNAEPSFRAADPLLLSSYARHTSQGSKDDIFKICVISNRSAPCRCQCDTRPESLSATRALRRHNSRTTLPDGVRHRHRRPLFRCGNSLASSSAAPQCAEYPCSALSLEQLGGRDGLTNADIGARDWTARWPMSKKNEGLKISAG